MVVVVGVFSGGGDKTLMVVVVRWREGKVELGCVKGGRE